MSKRNDPALAARAAIRHTSSVANQTQNSGAGQQRYIVFDNAFGLQRAADLMAYATQRQDDFTSAEVQLPTGGKPYFNPNERDCLKLRDLGPLENRFQTAINAFLPQVSHALGISSERLQPGEIELCAYGPGGHFHRHHDVLRRSRGTRELTSVYYFGAEPRLFSGGELRIHALNLPIGAYGDAPIDIEPVADRLIFFPSLLPHEVLEVRSPSPAWEARRFSLTCWIWRMRDEDTAEAELPSPSP
jgi:hypothetical protein